jgi:hypothetical protein
MAQAQTLTGARARLYINGNLIGVFTSASYEVNYGVSPIYILGRYNAAELVYTDMDTVTVSCSGFRVLNKGPYGSISIPKLQDLLNHQDFSLYLEDRQGHQQIMTVQNVRPLGYSTSTSARGVQDLSARFMGTVVNDENNPHDDDNGATNYGS